MTSFTALAAVTPDQLGQSIAVRHAAYCLPGLMACSAEQPYDPHDEHDEDPSAALYLLTDEHGVAIGSARLIHIAGGRREIQRLALLPGFAPGDENKRLRRTALLALLGRAVLDSIEDGCVEWEMSMRAKVLWLLSSMGMPFVLTGEPYVLEAADAPLSREPLYPASLQLLDLMRSMRAGYPRFFDQMFGDAPMPEDLGQAHIASLIARVQANLRVLAP